MSNVIVDKQKIDILANAISAKSGEPVTMTLDEMVEAVDGIEVGVVGTQNKHGSFTLSSTSQSIEFDTGSISQFLLLVVADRELRKGLGYKATSMVFVDFDDESEMHINTNNSGVDTMGYGGEISDTKHLVSRNGTVVSMSTDGATGSCFGYFVNTTYDWYCFDDVGYAQAIQQLVLQAKTRTISSDGTFVDTPDSGYDGLSSVTTTVPKAKIHVDLSSAYYNASNNQRKFRVLPFVNVGDTFTYGTNAGYISEGNYAGNGLEYNAIPTGTSVTPTESSQTIGGSNYMMEGSVTVNAISSNYVGSGITQRSSSDLTASGATVTAPSGYYSSAATKTVSSGTEGTPIATKGSVSNHSISVTPSVTNVAGYISGGTHSGTAVSVAASELVSGSQTITENDTYDVTNLASVVVNVSGGSASSVKIANSFDDTGGDRTSISFNDMLGEPTSFIAYISDSTALPSGTPYKTSAVVYDGTSHHAQILTNTSNAQASYDSSNFSHSYSNGTLTISSTGAHFNGDWILIYSYDGTSANVNTADVQVGSGATSITFTGLEDEPLYWSCIFKSNFGTSSGYQRVIAVSKIDASIAGLSMDSQARYSNSNWSSSYNNGSLTITSSGTNAGGYFHQPGYYQLTYVIGEASPYEKVSKTYRASTTAQSEKIEPSTGYDAMSEVNISIPAVTQTNLTAANIKSGTTVTISNGSTNLWSITGTYSGGGSGTVNIGTKTANGSNQYSNSISFTGLSGTPKAFFVRFAGTSAISSSGNTTYYYIIAIRWDGSSSGGLAGDYFRIGSTRSVTSTTSGYSYSYSGTTLTVTSSAASRSATPGTFYNGTYELVYVY